jgi:hypothetical protein
MRIPTNLGQYHRFVQTARELGVDNSQSPDAMDRPFERVVRQKKDGEHFNEQSHPDAFRGFSVGDRVTFHHRGKAVWTIESLTVWPNGRAVAALRTKGTERGRAAVLADLQNVT